LPCHFFITGLFTHLYTRPTQDTLDSEYTAELCQVHFHMAVQYQVVFHMAEQYQVLFHMAEQYKVLFPTHHRLMWHPNNILFNKSSKAGRFGPALFFCIHYTFHIMESFIKSLIKPLLTLISIFESYEL